MGCQLSKSNTCINLTCIKKNGNFTKKIGLMDNFLYGSFKHQKQIVLCPNTHLGDKQHACQQCGSYFLV